MTAFVLAAEAGFLFQVPAPPIHSPLLTAIGRTRSLKPFRFSMGTSGVRQLAILSRLADRAGSRRSGRLQARKRC
ncbi:hypothetical protein BQ8482_180157 [Mesorhizobium delmotii]|uniref:Uncharacterized protein n=1 Tax=Mesorhizobium delmotii TaxID=1631247 RepID=A0A2P9AIJ1_9HYPH|nr:hypothetical protein BQ8482_180157 [Mesorhizobium delmotii]